MVFWSDFVKSEYEERYDEKLENLSIFFQKLQFELENSTKEFYSVEDLMGFAKGLSGKSKKDVKSSLIPFWNTYSGIETIIPYYILKNNISDCLKDLSINTELNGLFLDNIMQLTPQRTRNYSRIDKMLESQGVSDEDRKVTPDGHDFACFSSSPVDFVTFDEDCYNGAKNVKILCFNSVKGKYDFRPS